MNWTEVSAISAAFATFFTMCAFIATAIYVATVVRAYARDRYLGVTNHLYTVFQSPDFMEEQMWLLHKLDTGTWEDFVRKHRGDYGELAFHRVGSYYDRVGTIIRRKLIQPSDILPTVGPYAIAVWHRIEPLVRGARKLENSQLFIDYEKILPDCYECYVPSLGANEDIRPFEIDQPVRPYKPTAAASDEHMRITADEVMRKLDRGDPILLLDVRQPSSVASDPRTLPHATVIPPADIEDRFRELPRDREIVAYCA